MATIGNIAVKISANTKQFIAGMGRAVGMAKKFGAGIVRLVAKIAKFGAVLVTAAVAGLTALTVKAFKAIDSLTKFADRVGLSTRMLAGLEHGASLAGISAESLRGSFERMVRRVGLFAAGSGAAALALKRMGFAADELISKNTGEQFRLIADEIAKLPTHAERSAAAFEIFGRQGQALLPILLGGAEGIERMVAEADTLGLTFDRVGGAKIENFNDAITRLKALFTGLGRTIAIVVAPQLEALAERFTSAATSAEGLRAKVGDAFKFIIRLIGKAADVLLVFQIAWKGAQHIVAGAIAGIVGSFNVMVQGGGKLLEFFGFEFQQGVVDAMDNIAQGMVDTADTFKEELLELARRPWPSEEAEKFFAKIEADAQAAAEVVAKAGEDMSKSLAVPELAELAELTKPKVSRGVSGGGGALQRGSSAAASAIAAFSRNSVRATELAAKRVEQKLADLIAVSKDIKKNTGQGGEVAGFA